MCDYVFVGRLAYKVKPNLQKYQHMFNKKSDFIHKFVLI